MESALTVIEYFVETAVLRLAAAFLTPGSNASIAALACTLAVFAPLALRTRRKRRLRRGTARRAMFPARLWKSASGRTDILFFLLGTMFVTTLIGWAVFSGDQVRGLAAGWLGPPMQQWLPGWASAAIATVV